MWRGKTVAVVFPTYNEKDSIREAILSYAVTRLVDDIIVVNNNAAAGTSEQIAGTGAREIFETRQGYGHALLCGLDQCSADLVILSEPDGTFSAQDLLKLLAYSDDVPVVLGTRTSRHFIWSGANMGNFLRYGNWAVAKLTEVLFNTTILTDMGCTHRLISRAALNLIRPHLSIGGSYFGPQILLEIIKHRIPFVEIPLNYLPRVGKSSVTGDLWKAFLLGCQMIGLVLAYRIGIYRRERTAWNPNPSVRTLQEDNSASLLNLIRATETEAISGDTFAHLRANTSSTGRSGGGALARPEQKYQTQD